MKIYIDFDDVICETAKYFTKIAKELNTEDYMNNMAGAYLLVTDGNGDKVKVSIRFRGREMAHSKLGLDVMERFGQAIEGGTIEKAAKLEGRNMLMFMAPKKA